MLKPRRQRRQEARESGLPFKPQYNTGIRRDKFGKKIAVGGAPKTYEEMYGVGYERFNTKLVTIKEAE